MAEFKFITSERLYEMFDKEERLEKKLIELVEHTEIEGFYCSIWRDKRTGEKYALKEIRTVHMGFNSNEPGKKEELIEIVEREGACNASWGVTGRTAHQILAETLSRELPQYKFEIGYNYKCLVRKV